MLHFSLAQDQAVILVKKTSLLALIGYTSGWPQKGHNGVPLGPLLPMRYSASLFGIESFPEPDGATAYCR
jgi:hypothetical protein